MPRRMYRTTYFPPRLRDTVDVGGEDDLKRSRFHASILMCGTSGMTTQTLWVMISELPRGQSRFSASHEPHLSPFRCRLVQPNADIV